VCRVVYLSSLLLVLLLTLSNPFLCSPQMVNVPKTRNTFCPGKKCRKHTLHKVTQYKAGKASLYAQGTFSLSFHSCLFLSLSRARARVGTVSSLQFYGKPGQRTSEAMRAGSRNPTFPVSSFFGR
jgi:hypothetical protein